MRHIRGIFIIFGLFVGGFGVYAVAAQSGGQFCVRSFQDTNGNGVLDAESEPLITRGMGIELLDAQNVIIASALLERSPNATDGVVCFQNLTDGEYSVLVSSTDYAATTPRLVQRTVSTSGLPVVVEFGAQRISTGTSAPVATSNTGLAGFGGLDQLTPQQRESLVLRASLATVGTVLVMLLMLMIGVFIYLLRMRGPAPAPAGYTPTTERFEPYRPSQTPPNIQEPSTNSADTGKVNSIAADETQH